MSAAEDIYHWIKASPQLQEESITDRLLYEMARQSTQITHFQHKRFDEARHGADWDWWIDSPRQKYAFRVQAKRMRPGHNHRGDILRQNQNGRQIDLLIASSGALNLYPIYALYGLPSGTSPCIRNHRLESVFVSPAPDVLSLAQGTPGTAIMDADLQSIALPMPCLFCCPLSLNGPSPGPIGVLDAYFGRYRPPQPPAVRPLLKTFTDDLDDDRSIGYHERLPAIVRELIEMEPGSEDADRAFDVYREQFAGTSGLLICRVE